MLTINKVNKSFNDFEVLKDISFDVKKSEIVSIIGESGCGKTTLLKILLGVEPLSSGTLTFSNNNRVGYVPQNLGLIEWRSVKKNITLPYELLGIKEYDIQPILKLMKLENFSDWRLSKLSGGMKQRIALARAMVNKPDILFLDEPHKSLDEITREHLSVEYSLLWKELCQTVIITTHSIKEAVYLSDKVIILSRCPATIKEIVCINKDRPRKFSDIDLYNIELKIRTILEGYEKK